MSRSWKFFLWFFLGHLLASVAYFFLSRELASGSSGAGAGSPGLGMFGGAMFLLSLGRGRPEVSALLFVLNSAVTAAVATGIFNVIRRLRSA